MRRQHIVGGRYDANHGYRLADHAEPVAVGQRGKAMRNIRRRETLSRLTISRLRFNRREIARAALKAAATDLLRNGVNCRVERLFLLLNHACSFIPE